MELTLNVVWLASAAIAFLLIPKRSGRVSLALICAAAFLFPIISASDDLTFNDASAAIVVSVVLAVAFTAISRLRVVNVAAYAVHVATPSDPRSPPAR